MILVGDINTTDNVHSLNGLSLGMIATKTRGPVAGVSGLGVLAHQSGDYVDPMRWRKGIQGLAAAGVLTLTPGLHGLGCGNAVMDCACKCGAAQKDQALVASLNGLRGIDDDTSAVTGGTDTPLGLILLLGVVAYAFRKGAR